MGKLLLLNIHTFPCILEFFCNKVMFFFKIFCLFIFRQRGREGQREEEKHQCVVASHAPPTGDLPYNLGMCPNWELNQ